MTVAHPHDAFFKKVFADPNNAAGELQSVLPAELVRAVDWATLTLQPGSFVDEALQGRHTDLLFSVGVDGGRRQALLYLLFEHFSVADHLTAFRVLRYMVRIWDRWLQAHEGASALPVVIPIVLYHDKKPWSAPRQLAELLDLPEALRVSLQPYLPQLGFVLDDLSAHDDYQLQNRAMAAMARLALLLFKHARHSVDLLDRFVGWADILAQVLGEPNGVEAFVTAMRYTMRVRDDLEAERLQEVIKRAQLGTRAEMALMNLEQRLIEKGVRQGEAGLLKRMLVRRFGVLPSWATQRIDDATSEQLDLWSERLDTAQVLVDVLGQPEHE